MTVFPCFFAYRGTKMRCVSVGVVPHRPAYYRRNKRVKIAFSSHKLLNILLCADKLTNEPVKLIFYFNYV